MCVIDIQSKDIFKWLDDLQDSPNIWITDPPYPFENKNGSGRFSYKNETDEMYSRITWDDMDKIIEQMYSKSADNASVYMFFNRDTVFKGKELLEKHKFKFRNMLVWDKVNMGMGYHYRNQVEYILYFTKGKPESFVTSIPNIFRYKKPKVSDSQPLIGYEIKETDQSPKPHQIYDTILSVSKLEDAIVADPFSGTKPLIVSANNPIFSSKMKKVMINSIEL